MLFLTVCCFIATSHRTEAFQLSPCCSIDSRDSLFYITFPTKQPYTRIICVMFLLSHPLLLSLSVSSVSCSICGFRQVSSQPVGGGNILGTDRPVGQPQSPSDPRPEDSSVSSCSHCKAASTVNMTHSYSPIQHTVSRDLTATHITPQ